MRFERFFEAIHGYAPFPWQRRAADRLVAGEPLEAVTVPTGSGKTAMIDAALFHAAQGGPRRIFFIIDRRVVVDETFERALRIQTALGAKPELQEFRQRLGAVQVVRLRGGVQGDDAWVWRPEQTTLALSTVDQVGSRLLHRGYGVSPRMWPVHAGMVGNQALYLVDEAHLSRPFTRTVQAARKSGADIRLIQLSATLGQSHEASIGLDAEDLAHPVLQKRLRASKEARLAIAPDPDNQFAPRVADKAESFLDYAEGDAPLIGIVVNRVKSARAVWQVLKKRKHQALLLIGPIRPFDRDRLMTEWLPQIHTSRERNRKEPLFVVATQTIEVGADLDFDALITEAAPLSALRQRFGRLDRLGHRGYAPAWILARESQLDPKKADKAPVYGTDILSTWRWLNDMLTEEEVVEFGLNDFEATSYGNPLPEERKPHCPTLLPTHIDLLSQTGPDAPGFDPAPWLHGPQRRSNEVNVVWRADLPEASPEQWAELVDLFPPTAREAVQVPITALRDLLAGKRGADIYDIEGGDPEETLRPAELRPLVVWSDAEESWQLHQNDSSALRLRPGTTVVLPSAYGGHDDFGWDLGYDKPVEDIAEECALEAGRPFSLRLTPALNKRLSDAPAQLEGLSDALGGYREILGDPDGASDKDLVAEAKRRLGDALAAIRHPFTEQLGKHYSITLTGPGALLTQRRLQDLRGAITGGVAVELGLHIDGVAATAEQLSADDPALEQIKRAALAHDLGKQAPPFQALLHGDKLRAAAGPVLAKSGLRSPRALRNAFKHSGCPRGFRHELHSLDLMSDEDPLVRYLVATHHGYGRPWFPACADPQAPGASRAELDQGWARAFAELHKQQGPWRLAGLELLLRSADIRRSIAEQDAAKQEGDDA